LVSHIHKKDDPIEDGIEEDLETNGPIKKPYVPGVSESL
jgi:hypothetical protein